MKRKTIDAMREVRLWVGQVIVPATILVCTLNPETRQNIANKIADVKSKFKNGMRV